MSRIGTQLFKEWAEFRRDRLAMALAFLLPLATLLLFGYGVRLQATHIPFINQDQDKSTASRSYIEKFDRPNVLATGNWEHQKDAEAAIKDGGAKGALVIPKDFEDDLIMGDDTHAQTIVDGSDINAAQVLHALAVGSNLAFLHDNEPDDSDRYSVEPKVSVLFNPDLKESLFIVPAVFGIILWMYPALLAAVAASREAESGTFVQIKSAGVRGYEVLLGKAIMYVAVGLAEAAAMLIIAAFVFGLKFVGDPTPFIVGTLLYVFGAVFFGLMIGAFTRAETIAVQATATGGFFPSLLLSGFVYPINNIPAPLNLVCAIVPATYYINVCRDAFVRGVGWSSAWVPDGALALFAAGLFAVSCFAMKQMRTAE